MITQVKRQLTNRMEILPCNRSSATSPYHLLSIRICTKMLVMCKKGDNSSKIYADIVQGR